MVDFMFHLFHVFPPVRDSHPDEHDTPEHHQPLRARLNKKMFHADKGARDFDEKIINLTSS